MPPTVDKLEPDDWELEPERRFAERQAALAETHAVSIASRIVETDDMGRVHYLEAGDPDGDPVLLLHGLTMTAATWLPLVPAIPDGYRVVIPDRPGRGLSAAPNWRGRDLRSAFITYLIELLDTLQLESVTVLGNSLGGLQAFLLTLDTDRVDRLCLIGAPGGVSRDFSIVWRLMTVQGVNRVLFWLLNRGDPLENAKTAAEQVLVADTSAITEEFYAVLAAGSQLPGRMASLRSMTSEEGSFGRMHPIWDIREEIVTIQEPTAFIWGTADSFWPPAVGQPLAEQMPAAEFHVLNDHGHMPFLEPGDETTTHVQSFLPET